MLASCMRRCMPGNSGAVIICFPPAMQHVLTAGYAVKYSQCFETQLPMPAHCSVIEPCIQGCTGFSAIAHTLLAVFDTSLPLCRNKDLNDIPLKVDLHGLHVHEAIGKLVQVIEDWRRLPETMQMSAHLDLSLARHLMGHHLAPHASWSLACC